MGTSYAQSSNKPIQDFKPKKCLTGYTFSFDRPARGRAGVEGDEEEEEEEEECTFVKI